MIAVGGDAQDDKEHDAFECCLVKLARVPRRIAGTGKHHGPGDVAHPPHHLGIDEIGDAAEEQAERRRRRGDVAERQRVDVLDAGEEVDGERHAEKPAMEGHAAVPHRGDFCRVGPEIARLIKQHEADPAPQHDAEGDPQQEVVGLGERDRRLAAPKIGARDEAARIEPAEQDACHIGKPVPADRDRSDLERDRVDHGIGNDQEVHRGWSGEMRRDPSPPPAGCQGAEGRSRESPAACALSWRTP